MGYGLEYAEQAARDLERLPPDLGLLIHRRLLLLAENPLELGRRVRAPIKGMFHGFRLIHGDDLWTISATFRFSADETRVVITALGWAKGG